MRQRSFRSEELRCAETDRRKGEGGVKPNDWRSVEKRGEVHL
jgi:hypothetical protein